MTWAKLTTLELETTRHVGIAPVALVSRVLTVSLIWLCLAIGANGAESRTLEIASKLHDLIENAPTPEQIEELKLRAYTGEAGEVIPIVREIVTNLDEYFGEFDGLLIQPLILLGDAHFLEGNYLEALQTYNRAFHISRMVDGLFSTDQLSVAYREANLLARMGMLDEANRVHEYAYGIMLKQHPDKDDPKRIQGMIRLLDWYEATRKVRAAKILYDDLRGYVIDNYPPAHPFALEVRRRYTSIVREVIFPSPLTKAAPRFFTRVPGYEPDPLAPRFDPYAEGRNELEQLNQITFSDPTSTELEKATSLLALGDWHVMFNRAYYGIEIYRQVWDLLESRPERQREALANPNLIHMNVTRSWLDPEHLDARQRKTGVVELALHINDRGKVIGRKTISTDPDDRMEYRVRVIARSAKYRPAFEDREPVNRRNVPLIYHYALPSYVTRPMLN